MYLQYGFTTLPLCQLLFLTLFNSSYFCCFLQAKCFYGHHVVLIKFHVAKFGNFTVNCLVLNIKEMEREREKKRLHDNIYNIQFHGPTNATLFSTLILHSSFFALFTATKQRVGLWELNSVLPYSD